MDTRIASDCNPLDCCSSDKGRDGELHIGGLRAPVPESAEKLTIETVIKFHIVLVDFSIRERRFQLGATNMMNPTQNLDTL